jgi:replicative DNA helicase
MSNPPLPHSALAERAVLSAMLGDHATAIEAGALLASEHFYGAANARLFGAIHVVAGRDGTADPVSVAEELERTGELRAAGGKEYLAELLTEVPTSEFLRQHAAIVREKAQLRAIIRAAEEIRGEAYRGELTARALAQHAGETLLPIAADDTGGAGFRSIRGDVYGVLELIEARARRQVAGLATGYDAIDVHTYGFRPKELVILAGVEKSGKTALALNIARHVAVRGVETGEAVGFVSAEMDRESLIERMLNAEAMVSSARTGSGRLLDRDFPALARAGGTLSRLALHIDDEATPDLADVVARCVALKARHPALALLVVDFLQIITRRESERTNQARHDEIEKICYALKGLAKRTNTTVLATSQLNSKDVDDLKDARPRLKDLAGSSGMRRAGDFIGLVYRPAMYDPTADDAMEVNFAACRRTPSFTARLIWDGAHMRVLGHAA